MVLSAVREWCVQEMDRVVVSSEVVALSAVVRSVDNS